MTLETGVVDADCDDQAQVSAGLGHVRMQLYRLIEMTLETAVVDTDCDDCTCRIVLRFG